MNNTGICNQIQPATIQQRIRTIRQVQVIIDHDLAELYGVETRILNQAVKRNINRFPEDFMFQLNSSEWNNISSQFVMTSALKRPKSALPYAFTEQGVAMLSGILKSQIAVDINIQIMRAFVAMRHLLLENTGLITRLETMEHYQLQTAQHLELHDSKIEQLFQLMEQNESIPKQGIFFNGQIFDAYTFVANLIRNATKQIVLIDNFIDDTVLTLLDKRSPNVMAKIYTHHISAQLRLDIHRHNQQYAPIEIATYTHAHDRFLAIDQQVYHIGASIKDLGKKLFAFSLMEQITTNDLMQYL